MIEVLTAGQIEALTTSSIHFVILGGAVAMLIYALDIKTLL